MVKVESYSHFEGSHECVWAEDYEDLDPEGHKITIVKMHLHFTSESIIEETHAPVVA